MVIFSVVVLPYYFRPPSEPPKQVNSLYINSTPQIDGEVDALWLSNATVVEPILNLVGLLTKDDTIVGSKMYVMNNDSFLFLGFFLLNKIYQYSILNYFAVYCDTNFDGSMDLDDVKMYDFQAGQYKDCWINIQESVSYLYQDAVRNGFFAFKHTNPVEGERGNYFFEIAIPFNTTLSDPSELNVTRGDSIIIAVNGFIYLGDGSSYLIQWPFYFKLRQVLTFGNITLG